MAKRTTQSDASMPLTGHLDELRIRLMWAIGGLVPLLLVCLWFGERLLLLVTQPAKEALRDAGQPAALLGLGPLEVFGAYMKLSLIATVVLGSPWLMFQLWRFVSPGLHRHERRFVYFLLPLSAVLTAAGVFLLYRFILPVMLSWLVTFGTGIGHGGPATAPAPEGLTFPAAPVLDADPVAPKVGEQWVNTRLMALRVCVAVAKDGTPDVRSLTLHKDAGIVQQFSVEKYVSLLLTMTLAFAAAFQAPIVTLLLGWVGLIDQKFIAKFRRHAVFVCAIVAAFITPGDPASMIMMWVPLVLLYELGGILLRLFPASRVAGKIERPPEDDDGAGEG
jgi:Sec-independent protein secretion pathway component TatC